MEYARIESFKIMRRIRKNCKVLAVILCLLLTVSKSSEFSSRLSDVGNSVSRCPKNHFKVDNMAECRPLLRCSDLENVKFLKLIGYGTVKWVFLGEWNRTKIAVSVLKTPLYSDDFGDGLDFLASLAQNRFVVQLVGHCERHIVATEYHRLNNANSLKYILREKAPSFDLPAKLCLNFVELFVFLHESPVGVRVNCDSDSVEKILSQIAVSDDLTLVLIDVDALPEFFPNATISCGKKVIRTPSSLIPPELEDPLHPMGYSPKSDVWKIPDVCNYFFSLTESDPLYFSLYDITRICKHDDPSSRPSAKELVVMYREKLEFIRSEFFNRL